MNKQSIKVMVAGHICLDITPAFNPGIKGTFSEIFAPGKLINVEQAVLSTGGAVPNTGGALSRLGFDVRLNGKVGNDMLGDMIKNSVGRENAAAFKTVSGQSSSYSIVLSLPNVDRIFLHHPGTNDTFVADDIDYEMLSECSLLHFGYPTLMKKMYENDGIELLKIFQKAKELGVVTSMDVTLPDPDSDSGKADWEQILKKVLPFVDIFLPSVEEIAYMLNRELYETRKKQSGNEEDPVIGYTSRDCSELSEKLLEYGAKIAVIKVGIQGCYLRTSSQKKLTSLSPVLARPAEWANREIRAGSYKADRFGSATGAGDALIAGFLAAFLKGLGPVQSVKAANILGWQNVREVDTLSGIEDWNTTLGMIQDSEKPLNPLDIHETGWRYCTDQNVFLGPNDRDNQ